MKVLAYVIFIGSGIISFFWSMAVIIAATGFWGGLVAFMFAPIMIIFAPFYVGFRTGDWTLLAITYGGTIVGGIVFVLSKDE